MKESKDKILFILHYSPPIHGSAVVGKNIKESKVINEAFDAKYINLATSFSVDEIGKKSWKKIWRYFAIIWRVFMNLIFFKPKTVYMAITVSGNGFYKDSIIVFLVKCFNKSIIYHLHNKGVALGKSVPLKDYLYKRVFRSSKTILLTKSLYYDIKDYVNKSDIFYCPNGILDFNFNEYADKKSESIPVILFLSNLIESKGVYTLVDACKILKERGLSFSCKFIGGEGNITKNELEKYIKDRNLSDSVYYLGRMIGNDKQRAFANSDIFVFPTFYHNECFPLVLLEAMQHSLPIVSTNEGGIIDIVNDGKNGFIAKRKDTVDFADKIEILIKDEDLRKKMGAYGRQKFEENFTIKKFEENMLTVLKNCIKR